jgi:DNA modification methylase/ParB-like chromosome segregation protein Spo0J
LVIIEANGVEAQEMAMEIRDRVVELRRVRARDLLPNPRNWRKHPKIQADALRGLLNEIGIADALLARELADGTLQLIDGHLRKEILPDEEVPVLVLDLDEAEADKLLLSLDPLAGMAAADGERLQALLDSVRTEDPAIQALLDHIRAQERFALENLSDLVDPEPQLDKADELRRKWGTAVGQLWQVGQHRLACGDCRDPDLIGHLWDDGQKLRLIWCDPPYGIAYSAKNAQLNRSDRGNRIQKPILNDALGPEEVSGLFRDALKQALAFATRGAACYATVPSGTLLPYFIAAFNQSGFSYRHLLVWLKSHFVIGMCDYQQRHEVVLYGWRENGPHFFVPHRGQSSVFEVDKPQVSDLHPTTKPIALIAPMIANSSRPGEIVYDPFCGSGSTIVAAAQIKRVGYGCELDPGYLAVELERLTALGLKPERRS